MLSKQSLPKKKVRPKSTPTPSDGRDDIDTPTPSDRPRDDFDILRTVAIDTPRSLKREQSTTSGLPIIRLLHKCNLQHILCDNKKLLLGIAIVLITITAVANEGRTPSIKTENVLKQTGISSSNGLDGGKELPVFEESDNINLLRGRPSSKSKNDSKCGVIFFYHINKVGGRTVQGKIISFLLSRHARSPVIHSSPYPYRALKRKYTPIPSIFCQRKRLDPSSARY